MPGATGEDLEVLLEVAVRAAERGAEILRSYYGKGGSGPAGDLRVEEKARNDYVSRADRESEEVIIETILDAFPSHRLLAEESGAKPSAKSDFEWIIDPLDGTTNFLRGVPYFCVSIACLFSGKGTVGVVLDPLREDFFTSMVGRGAQRNGESLHIESDVGLAGAFLATGFPFKAHPALESYLGIFRDAFLEARGIRRCGAAALDLAYTAAGVYDGFFEFCLSPWDLAAGCLLIEEAGGVVSDLDGGDSYLERGSVLAGPATLHREMLEVVGRHTSEKRLAECLR